MTDWVLLTVVVAVIASDEPERQLHFLVLLVLVAPRLPSTLSRREFGMLPRQLRLQRIFLNYQIRRIIYACIKLPLYMESAASSVFLPRACLVWRRTFDSPIRERSSIMSIMDG